MRFRGRNRSWLQIKEEHLSKLLNEEETFTVPARTNLREKQKHKVNKDDDIYHSLNYK